MKRYVLPAALACAAILAGPALAQSGSRLSSVPPLTPADPFSEDGIRTLLDQFAGCVISRHRKHVESYLRTPPDSQASDREWPTIAREECLSIGTLTLSDAGFRAAAYGRLYKSDFGKKGPVDFSNVPPIDYAAGLDVNEAVDRTNIGSRALADCTVRAEAAHAKTLVLSRIASKAEAAAFGALMPAASNCLKQGANITFSKAALRGLIAEALYRLSQASRDAARAGAEAGGGGMSLLEVEVDRVEAAV